MAIIYGVDTEKDITPEMVRSAIVDCFCEAHCAEAGVMEKKGESENREYCRSMVQKCFSDSGGDFDKPTKASLEKAVEALQESCKTFKVKGAIEEHASQIKLLISKIK